VSNQKAQRLAELVERENRVLRRANEIRGLLPELPDLPATVIAERVGSAGVSSVLQAQVALLRAQYRPPDPADRTTYTPGQIVQCDLWFPD